MKRIWIAALAPLLAAPAFAQAPTNGAGAASEPLQPISKWNLDEGANACVLERAFGTTEQKWSVGLLPRLGFPRMELLLILPKGLAGADGDALTVTLRPSGAAFVEDPVTNPTKVGGLFMRRISIDNSLLDAVPANTELAISSKRGPRVSFALQAGAEAVAALKSCGDELLKSWGVELARFRPVVPPGQPGYIDLAKYLGRDDYPPLAGGTPGGRTTALLAVGADGKVRDCRVVESSGTPAFDGRTCQIAITRLHYPPVQDSVGPSRAGRCWRYDGELRSVGGGSLVSSPS